MPDAVDEPLDPAHPWLTPKVVKHADYCAWKMLRRFAGGLGPVAMEWQEDVKQDILVEMTIAAQRRWDPEKGKFLTLFGNTGTSTAFRRGERRLRGKFKGEISIDRPVGSDPLDDEWNYYDSAAAEEQPAHEQELSDEMYDALDKLRYAHRSVLKMRFVEQLKFTQIGARYGVTESRACQLYKDALCELRRVLCVSDDEVTKNETLTRRRIERHRRERMDLNATDMPMDILEVRDRVRQVFVPSQKGGLPMPPEMQAAFAALPERQRAALLALEVEDVSCAEYAQRVGYSTANVYVLRNRALDTLGGAMKPSRSAAVALRTPLPSDPSPAPSNGRATIRPLTEPVGVTNVGRYAILVHGMRVECADADAVLDLIGRMQARAS